MTKFLDEDSLRLKVNKYGELTLPVLFIFSE
jgi:hypothetical protein